ncbi:hypothetical protein [Halomarina litorea]|uniref:hypothetical protein n=1 Tax=Halomarina litorea TaxID=2961595 RepID=UPI0020C23C69|nr:hypothetical protein [Halomarina sp. BCD28]
MSGTPVSIVVLGDVDPGAHAGDVGFGPVDRDAPDGLFAGTDPALDVTVRFLPVGPRRRR